MFYRLRNNKLVPRMRVRALPKMPSHKKQRAEKQRKSHGPRSRLRKNLITSSILRINNSKECLRKFQRSSALQDLSSSKSSRLVVLSLEHLSRISVRRNWLSQSESNITVLIFTEAVNPNPLRRRLPPRLLLKPKLVTRRRRVKIELVAAY